MTVHPLLPLKEESLVFHSLRVLGFTKGSCFSAELECDTKAWLTLLSLAHFKSFLLFLAPLLTTNGVMVAGLQGEADCRLCDLVLVLDCLNACLYSRRYLVLAQATKSCDGPTIWEAASL